MSRSASRWLVLGVLLVAVIGLGIYNTVANRRLVTELADGKPAALAELAARQDAYIFLQAEGQPTRAEIASHLGQWSDERAAGLIVKLLPDPDAEVRSNLIRSLAVAAERDPIGIAAELAGAPPVIAAALIEAATEDVGVGLRVLEYSLDSNQDNEAGYLLAKRIGSPSKNAMVDIVRGGDSNGVRLAADVLSGLALSPQERALVGAKIYASYSESDDAAYRDRLLPVMAKFAPSEALTEFRQVAIDHTAPSELRVAATQALIALGDKETLARLRGDSDTNVAAILK